MSINNLPINYKILENFCNEPEQEVQNIKSSFDKHVELAEGSTFRPKLMLFDYFKNKKFGLSSRQYVDLTDLYATVSEMMYSFSALSAYSCVLVLDTNLNTSDDSQQGGPTGALVVYFASEDHAIVIKLYYSINESNVVTWFTNKDSFDEITIESLADESYRNNKILELLFIHTHIDSAPFSQPELLSYYSLKGYNFKPFRDLKTSYMDFSYKN